MAVALTYGVDGRVESTDGKRNNAPRPEFPDAHGRVAGAFVQPEIRLWDSVSLTPGLRFDYYYRKDTESRNMDDVKMTDGGRTVYGGGGISPDEKFTPEKLTPLEIQLLTKFAFSEYTKHFFAVHKEKLPAGWTVSNGEMESFHNWLLDKKIEFSEADYTKDFAKVKRRLQSEIYKTAFSVDEASKYEIQTDPEVEAAVSALPKAESLLANTRKIRADRRAK